MRFDFLRFASSPYNYEVTIQSKPILTIVTPVYNGANFINETVDSVLLCIKHKNIEYLIINDGSTDLTLECLSEYANEIRVISQENKGESEAVNKGILESKSDYVLVVSADDPLFTTDLFEFFHEEFEKDSNLVAIYTDWRMINEQGAILRNVLVPEYSDALLIGKNKVLPGPGTIFRRSAALKIGGRRSKWRFVGDYDFWLRLSLCGEIRHRPGIFAQWRSHSESTSISNRGPEMARERIAVISEFLEESHGQISPRLASSSLANAHYLAARLSFFSRKVNGRKLFLESLKIKRGWPEEAKIYEALFLISFPISKIALDLITKFMRMSR